MRSKINTDIIWAHEGKKLCAECLGDAKPKGNWHIGKCEGKRHGRRISSRQKKTG